MIEADELQSIFRMNHLEALNMLVPNIAPLSLAGRVQAALVAANGPALPA